MAATELVSVDCVMEAPEEWALSSFNEESEAAIASDMATSDALLLGRVTYEALTAYWPHQPSKDIGIVGSGALLRSLLAGEPLDELGLIVHPLVLGSGKRLLGDGLSEGAEGGGLEDVRHGHSLPHLPVGGRWGAGQGSRKPGRKNTRDASRYSR